MAKLADAADLKSAGRKAVGVQVPLWAPYRFIILRTVPWSPSTSTAEATLGGKEPGGNGIHSSLSGGSPRRRSWA